jgi:transcriptional regulator with XRE-family HTH domain
MGFGSRLAERRKAKGLTQDQLGKGLGTDGKDVGKAVVWGWEKEQHHRVDQLILICERLGVSSDWLLFGREATNVMAPEFADLAATADKLPPRQREFVLDLFRNAVTQAPELLPEPGAVRNSAPSRRMKAA